ncbi:Card1-like endonuclease domain-containing protein [Algivirga pacifica]|uniref:DUF1887 family CARF protein n=1 Tax=Algivirga pacifica TaxID=1162670 RepID=A0ABP9D5B5_9BACT
MKKINILLISDQSLPNLLFIKEWKADAYIFITTEAMEKKQKSVHLIKGARLAESNVHKIVVDGDDTSLILQALSQEFEAYTENIYFQINLTGGTKMMSLATYAFFSSNENCEFWYKPATQDLWTSVNKAFDDRNIKYQCTLWEYLTIYGLEMVEKGEPIWNSQKAWQVYHEFKKVGFDKHNYSHIKDAHTKGSAENRSYYGGGWFEDLMYYVMQEELSLGDDYLAYNVKLHKVGKESDADYDNEFDIMFMNNNRLFVIEGKATLPFKNPDKVAEAALYKLAALKSYFGLFASTCLVSLGQFSNKKNIERRSRLLGLKEPLDNTKIGNKGHMIKKLMEFAGIKIKTENNINVNTLHS